MTATICNELAQHLLAPAAYEALGGGPLDVNEVFGKTLCLELSSGHFESEITGFNKKGEDQVWIYVKATTLTDEGHSGLPAKRHFHGFMLLNCGMFIIEESLGGSYSVKSLGLK